MLKFSIKQGMKNICLSNKSLKFSYLQEFKIFLPTKFISG